MISSSNNTRIKALRSLRDKKRDRQETGQIFVEGAREVARALVAGLACVEILYCDELLDDSIKGILANNDGKLLSVTKDVLNHLVVRKDTPTLVGVFRIPQWTLASLSLRAQPLLMIIENLEKPGNLGAVMRTADGAGVDAILLTGESVDCFNPNVIRSSLGTAFGVPTVNCTNEQALDFCGRHRLTCFAAAPQANSDYYHESYTGPTAFVLGNEAAGLSGFWLEACRAIALPMHGIADSLNISATAAVLVYEALRQRSLPT